MKNVMIPLMGFLSLLTACSTHYYKKNGDTISFYLKSKDAQDVHFQYSLDGFSSHEAENVKGDTWCVSVPSVREFSYFYMVDGKVYIPPCQFTEKDDFGNENCIFTEGL
jgi:hypothetical protein